MELQFFQPRGRTSSIKEMYNIPCIRVPQIEEGKRAAFEFNTAFVDQLGISPEQNLVFTNDGNRVFFIVLDELPEGQKAISLSIGKSEQKSDLGKVRKSSSKPVGLWFNGVVGSGDFFAVESNLGIHNGAQIYELTSTVQEVEQMEAQTQDSFNIEIED